MFSWLIALRIIITWGSLTWLYCENFPDAIAYRHAYYGQGTVPILLDDVRCTNTESRLIDCPYTSIDNCVHSEDAAVSCTTSNKS